MIVFIALSTKELKLSMGILHFQYQVRIHLRLPSRFNTMRVDSNFVCSHNIIDCQSLPLVFWLELRDMSLIPSFNCSILSLSLTPLGLEHTFLKQQR